MSARKSTALRTPGSCSPRRWSPAPSNKKGCEACPAGHLCTRLAGASAGVGEDQAVVGDDQVLDLDALDMDAQAQGVAGSLLSRYGPRLIVSTAPPGQRIDPALSSRRGPRSDRLPPDASSRHPPRRLRQAPFGHRLVPNHLTRTGVEVEYRYASYASPPAPVTPHNSPHRPDLRPAATHPRSPHPRSGTLPRSQGPLPSQPRERAWRAKAQSVTAGGSRQESSAMIRSPRTST